MGITLKHVRHTKTPLPKIQEGEKMFQAKFHGIIHVFKREQLYISGMRGYDEMVKHVECGQLLIMPKSSIVCVMGRCGRDENVHRQQRSEETSVAAM